jgi:hypothetical protein
MGKYLFKKCSIVKEFKVDGTFESMYAAQGWLLENGYSYGSTCSMMPVAVIKGEYNLPQKWKNFTSEQKDMAHGVIVGEMREGPVYVRIFEQ